MLLAPLLPQAVAAALWDYQLLLAVLKDGQFCFILGVSTLLTILSKFSVWT